jgi:hypothetical protein
VLATFQSQRGDLRMKEIRNYDIQCGDIAALNQCPEISHNFHSRLPRCAGARFGRLGADGAKLAPRRLSNGLSVTASPSAITDQPEFEALHKRLASPELE